MAYRDSEDPVPEARIIIVPDIHTGYRQSRVAEPVRLLPGWISAALMPRPVFIGDVLDQWRARPADALKAARRTP